MKSVTATFTANTAAQTPAPASAIRAVLTDPVFITSTGLLVLVMTSTAHAGTTGEEFKGLFDLLMGWAQGYLARALAIAASIAGALYGLAKQNPIISLIGIVFAVILSIGPSIINGIVTAVI